MSRRLWVLAGLLVGTGLLALVILRGVLGTVFFGITVAYVLYPLRRFLVDRGASRRVAALLTTLIALLAAATLVVPLLWSLYRRRSDLIGFLRALPDVVALPIAGGATVTVELSAYVAELRQFLQVVAVAVAQSSAVLALKGFLFLLLVYGLLLRPRAAGTVAYRTVPRRYHDVLHRMHVRTRETLTAIYVLQGATALATFLVGYVVFAGLGYDNAFLLAILGGILQFIPVIGPSVVVAVVAATDLAAGLSTRAAAVLVLGLVFVGFLPDAVVRPQLAPYAAGIPATLYFVGFTGGVLSVGLVGFIAGPLVVALFVESVDLLAEERGPAPGTTAD